MTHVSVDMRQRVHLIRVAGHLGVRLPATRHPFSALTAGVNPGPVPVYKGPPSVHVSTCWNCGISTVFSQTAPEELMNLHTGTSTTSSVVRKTGGNSLCVKTGMSTTWTCTTTGMSITNPNAQLGTVSTCLCGISAMSTLSMSTVSLHNDWHVINTTMRPG